MVHTGPMPGLPPTHEFFARAALPAYGRPGEVPLRLLSLSENATYLVEDDEPIVLRVHRPGYHSLEAIRSVSDIYIRRGITVPSLDREKKWQFTPSVKEGDRLSGGMVLGTVQETNNILHRILAPPGAEGVESMRCTGGLTATPTVRMIQKSV